MRITKDEARILAAAMEMAKYDLNILALGVFDKLEQLEDRLNEFGKDKRRTGRTSMDDFHDCMKRFAKAGH